MPDILTTPYHLTEEQLAFYDDNGYLILRNRIQGELLERLQKAGRHWIDAGYQAAVSDNDYIFADRPKGRVMFRVDYVHNKGEPASLEMLGSPEVLGIAESMCGPNFVPTYESMVFKEESDGEAIPWHQDAVHPRRYRIFNLDLYLDYSKAGMGALRVIPGSQIQRQDVCSVRDRFGWDHPSAIDVEMAPGDVLLHDVMVVHGSARTAGNALRRTIYYEFRAAEEIIEDGPWDREWIDRRIRLIPLGLRAYEQQFPTASQFDWHVSDTFRPVVSPDTEAELKVVHQVHMNGSWCSAGTAG